MAISWTIRCNSVDITSSVISARFSMGRQNPLDDYDANYCQITVRNGTGAFNAGTYPISSIISFTPNTANGKTRVFWLQTINYTDEIEPTASTATLVGIDGYGRLGQFILRGPTGVMGTFYNQTRTIAQSDAYIIAANIRYGSSAVGIGSMAEVPTNPVYAVGDSTIPTLDSSGGGEQPLTPLRRVLDWINQNHRTERTPWDVPAYALNQGQYWGIARSKFADRNIGITIGNASSATDLLWDQFSRVGLGGNYYNRVNVDGYGTTAITDLSTSTYGVTELSVSTRDKGTQTTDNSSYIAQTLSATTNLFATISFLDAIQNTTAMATFLAFKSPVTGWLSIKYQDPGVGILTRTMQLDGVDVDIRPGATRFTTYLSDINLYSFFTLDNATFGVLDDDRLGW